MALNGYNLLALWPDFGRLLVGDVYSPEGLSALIVAIIFFVALVSGIAAFIKYFFARRRIRFYRRLLKTAEPASLLEQRRDIANGAMKSARYGQLWREFDESLVHVPARSRLCNTLDASHFFNTHTLAGGLTENRLLAAVPAFITAIGVIGTFAGLQMGLSELTGNMGDTPQIEQLKTGIFGMIGGASIAFMTSVWGVLVSVLFNAFEKVLERSVRNAITGLQNRVDYLYPRITAEQSLSNIEEFNRQSTEKLAELDEKIGHKMQEAMSQASDTIRAGMEQSLTNILGPAIAQLVNNANAGSERALESLLERFMQGVGSAGESQRAMMENAADGVRSAASTMSEGLQGFVAQLETQMASAFTQNAAAVSEVREALSSQMEAQQRRDMERHSALNQQFAQFQGAQGQLTESIQTAVATQQAHSLQLTRELEAVIEQFGAIAASNREATRSLQTASSDMKASAINLGQLSDAVKTSVDGLGERLGAAADSVAQISRKNEDVLGMYQGIARQLEATAEQIQSASAAMDSAAGRADSGLSAVDRHFTSLATALETHVQQLQRQVAELLNEYAKRVQDQTVTRLNTWNEQTNAYIGAMTGAVQALNDVVDEIDGKVQARRTDNAA